MGPVKVSSFPLIIICVHFILLRSTLCVKIKCLKFVIIFLQLKMVTLKQGLPPVTLGLLVPKKCALRVLVLNGKALEWKIAVFLALATDRSVAVIVSIL